MSHQHSEAPHLHHEVQGEGEIEFVICNGLSQSTANWRGIARQGAEHRWILFDTRGHGKSTPGPRPYSLDDHVADLTRVLDARNVEKPILIGFSHGGRVAIRAAALYPERFAALVLVSVGALPTARRKAYMASWENCLKLGGLPGLAWASLPNIVGRKVLERFGDLEMMVKGTVTRNQEQGMLAMFEGMRTYPSVESDARLVPLPTLVFRGGEDPLVDQNDLAALKDWIKLSETITFEDCGHTLPLEEPTRFLEELARFAVSLRL